MEKASIEPPEEEEEERPIVNGNGVAVTPGQPRQRPPWAPEAEVAGARSLVMTAGFKGRAPPGQADLQELIVLFKSWQRAHVEWLPSNRDSNRLLLDGVLER